MHILLIHQAFASIDEPGGTRHYELARFLTERGHRVTVITSPVSYLTGSSAQSPTPRRRRRAAHLERLHLPCPAPQLRASCVQLRELHVLLLQRRGCA